MLESTKSESFYHKKIKQLIFECATERNKAISDKSLEKYLNSRRADVYFKMKSGDKIAVEVQNSKITVKEIKKRTEDYTKKGIYVLWILHGMGPCVASKKRPENKRDCKISTTESFLHRIYFGRVYYVNVDINKKRGTTISTPFALHYSSSSKKKNRKMFSSHYEKYFIRNVNFMKIPNWNLLTVDYNGFKLARFYDKNVKSVLKREIHSCVSGEIGCNRNNKKIRKLVLKRFSSTYGSRLILESLLELIKENKL